jgi:plastocyanin
MIVLSACVLIAGSCGGSGGYGGSTPSAPTNTSTQGGVVTITIRGVNGKQSFAPNPAQCAAGQSVVWFNSDTVTHRVVLDDLSVDTGDILPGRSTAPMALGSVSKAYHCSLHPNMVGSLNNAETPEPPRACEPYC